MQRRTDELPAELLNIEEAQEAFEPPAEFLDWLCEHVVPLDTVAPITYNQDLAPLREMIGEARVVALGEATHGTSEFFTLKHRIVQFLAEEMDFTVFSIEANMPRGVPAERIHTDRRRRPERTPARYTPPLDMEHARGLRPSPVDARV